MERLEKYHNMFRVYLSAKYKNFKVFVIDNNSQDNTFEKIEQWSNNKIKINERLVKHKNKN